MSTKIDLPDESYLHVFKELEPQVLGRCCCVSKRWRQLASDNSLWNSLYDIEVPAETNIKEYYATHVIKSLEGVPRCLEEMIVHAKTDTLQRFIVIFQKSNNGSHLLQYNFGYSTEEVLSDEKIDEVIKRHFQQSQTKICYFVNELPDEKYVHWKSEWGSRGRLNGQYGQHYFNFVELHESDYIFNNIDMRKIKNIISGWFVWCSRLHSMLYDLRIL